MARWAPLPSSAARYSGSVAVSVLPSPVCISTIELIMDGRAAQQLHVEVPHVELAPARLAHQGERLDQQPVERLAAAGPVAERQAHLLEIVVALGHQPLFQRGDPGHQRSPLRESSAQRAAHHQSDAAQESIGGCGHI